VTFSFKQEGDELVEKKRLSSSSTGDGGTMDCPLFSGDFRACEACPGWTWRDPAVDVDKQPNMSSGPIGRVSRSESPSRSESGGTKDFPWRGGHATILHLFLCLPQHFAPMHLCNLPEGTICIRNLLPIAVFAKYATYPPIMCSQ
jgi:hypothetical protein